MFNHVECLSNNHSIHKERLFKTRLRHSRVGWFLRIQQESNANTCMIRKLILSV